MKNKQFILAYVVPTLLILAWAVLPLIRGTHTFYLRDVFNSHLQKKLVQVAAMEEGYLPLVDPLRDGGQPLLGNPNSVALYPDNLLFLVASPFWALNAHFWLHLVLAPFSGYWLARSWGFRKEAAWAAGVCFAGSGYFLSTLNLYNLVAGVALTPALTAAMMELSGPVLRSSRLVAVAGLWTLLLLSGDPMTAAAALFLALSAVVFRWGFRQVRWPLSVVAIGLGTLIALPQLVEFLRILPLTFRGHWGFTLQQATVASWEPATAAELLVPFFFGQPDLTFWGKSFFSNNLPLFVTLYPGVLALALIAVSGKPRDRSGWWAWAMVALGLFLVLGKFNPLIALLWKLPGASLLRLPVKFWLLIAVGSSLLCAAGFERLFASDRRQRDGWILTGLTLFYFLTWLALTVFSGPVDAWARGLVPDSFSDQLVDHERVRWAGLCLLSFVALLMLGFLWRLAGRWPTVAGAALLAFHMVFQFVVLKPAVAFDEVAEYQKPSPLLDVVPEGAIVMHGKAGGSFGDSAVPVSEYPDPRILWLQRQTFQEIYPVAGIMYGRRYEFSVSPEGLDSFLTRATGFTFPHQSDLGRVRILAASGVEYLLVDRELDPETDREVDLVRREPSTGGEILVYRLVHSAPAVQLVGRVLRAPHLNAALTWMISDDFDPTGMTVLPEGGSELDGPSGSVIVELSAPEELEISTESVAPGALVVQRAFLPLYRATVDGQEAPIVAANIHRLGIEVPAGSHRVRVWIDRRPLWVSSLVALAALVALIGLAWRLRGSC
ncbi:MAG: hypothetical protein WBO69_01670 [Thermoanaerobaculia bacterium]